MEAQETKIQVPEFTPHINSKKDDVCPVCLGSGMELFTTDPNDFVWLYGDRNISPQSYVRKCRTCNGFVKGTVDNTEVPFDMTDADITRFDFNCYEEDHEELKKIAEDFIVNFSKWEGKGFYLWSKTPGSGKTFLAVCICKSAMMRNRLRFKFITVPDYIDKCGEAISIRKNGGFYDPSKIYKECELLVFDDLGAQIGKEWQQHELFKLINERCEKKLTTIFTSNYPISSVNVDERSKSRIFKTSIQIQMPEESIREKKANSEQMSFIKGILKNGENN